MKKLEKCLRRSVEIPVCLGVEERKPHLFINITSGSYGLRISVKELPGTPNQLMAKLHLRKPKDATVSSCLDAFWVIGGKNLKELTKAEKMCLLLLDSTLQKKAPELDSQVSIKLSMTVICTAPLESCYPEDAPAMPAPLRVWPYDSSNRVIWLPNCGVSA